MSTTDWHVDDALWARYADGMLEPVTEAAVERHVTGCPRCRESARSQAEPPPDLWAAVHTEISAPRLPRALRWAARRDVHEDDLTLLYSGRDYTHSGGVALGAAMVCAILVAVFGSRDPFTADVSFLVLAPLVPLLAVVATYDATDPLRELTVTTPFSMLRLALLRAAIALMAALPVTAVLGALIPGVGVAAAAWLVPGIVLSLAALVLLTWTTARTAGVVAGGGWVLAAVVAARGDALDGLADPAGQLLTVVVGLALLLLLFRRTSVQSSFPGVRS